MSLSATSCLLCLKSCLFSHQEAIETFKEALKLKADFIDAYKSLGQAYRYFFVCLRENICFSLYSFAISLTLFMFFLCLES